MSRTTPIIELHEVTKTYGTTRPTPVLDQLSVQPIEGECLVLAGASRRGKGALPDQHAGLDAPGSGKEAQHK